MSSMPALVRKADVDPTRVHDALLGRFAQSRILGPHGLPNARGDYEPGFKPHLHGEDLAIALVLGREERAPVPATAQAAALMDALLAQGARDRDHPAPVTLYEQLASAAERIQAR